MLLKSTIWSFRCLFFARDSGSIFLKLIFNPNFWIYNVGIIGILHHYIYIYIYIIYIGIYKNMPARYQTPFFLRITCETAETLPVFPFFFLVILSPASRRLERIQIAQINDLEFLESWIQTLCSLLEVLCKLKPFFCWKKTCTHSFFFHPYTHTFTKKGTCKSSVKWQPLVCVIYYKKQGREKRGIKRHPTHPLFLCFWLTPWSFFLTFSLLALQAV